MPNPLTRVTLVSRRSSVDDKPQPVTPIPEEYAGDNIPYRGIENHGVDSTNKFRDPETDMPDPDGRLVDVYETEGEPPEPIPVYLVNSGRRERRAFRIVISYATGTDNGSNGRMVLGADESRTKAAIKNPVGSPTVYISDAPESANAVSGFPLSAGETYVTESQGAVYATVDSATDQPLPIAVEHRVTLDA